MPESGEVTQLPTDARDGDARALDRAIPLVYDESCAAARRQRAGARPGYTLDRIHFLSLSARLTRRVFINHAERGGAAKRGGGRVALPLEDVMPSPATVKRDWSLARAWLNRELA